MDITTVFGTVVPGSSPGRGTRKIVKFNLLSIMVFECGYSLVVEHIVANDKTGVRFSLPAQDNNNNEHNVEY